MRCIMLLANFGGHGTSVRLKTTSERQMAGGVGDSGDVGGVGDSGGEGRCGVVRWGEMGEGGGEMCGVWVWVVAGG